MVGTIVVGQALDGPGTAAIQPEISVAARQKLEEQMAWAKSAAA